MSINYLNIIKIPPEYEPSEEKLKTIEAEDIQVDILEPYIVFPKNVFDLNKL
jgi:hypothetical protein